MRAGSMRGLRLTAASLAVILTMESTALLAIDGDKVAYFGGAHAAYASAKEPIEAELNTRLEEALLLRPTQKESQARIKHPLQPDT